MGLGRGGKLVGVREGRGGGLEGGHCQEIVSGRACVRVKLGAVIS